MVALSPPAGASPGEQRVPHIRPDGWLDPGPQAALGLRCCFGYAYFPEMQRIVLYGGTDSLGRVLDDTLLLDATNDQWSWSLLCNHCNPGPGARRSTRMVYDGAHHNLVLFGGNSSATDSPDTLLEDTWILDSTGTWSLCGCTSHPSRRSSPGMAWDQDPARNNVVLFGGYGSVTDCGQSHRCGDTWIFTGTNWSPQFPITSPSARSSPALAWEGSPQNQVVLYGGITDLPP